MYSTPQKIELHKKYWALEEMEKPIVSFKIAPDFFFSDHFGASKALLKNGQEITPEMICVAEFIPDYRRYYDMILQTGQSAFYTVEPFVGFPWIEAMCGCKVYATNDSFITHHSLSSVSEYEKVKLSKDNPWFKKWCEFVSMLWAEFGGEMPIGQPITRGIADTIGALIGQQEMVFALYDEEDEVKELIKRISEIYFEAMDALHALSGNVWGGTAFGFYHLWAPGKCAWYQDDLTAILTPKHYKQFIKPFHIEVCDKYDYTGVHLHSSSFHMLDEILEVEKLKVVEINKDVGGLSVSEMLDTFKKVQNAGKRLIIWGDLTTYEIKLVRDALQPKGLMFNIIAPTVEYAKEVMNSL